MAVSEKPGTIGGADYTFGWRDDTRDSALAQLDRILNSVQFRTSKRCSLFLRYVVEHAASQDIDGLKERTLGVDVFGRNPKYDTNQDPVVRIAAGEVRKRLAQYYLEPGHEDELRISLAAGGYIPEIHLPPAKTGLVAAPLTPTEFALPAADAEPARMPPRRRYRLWLGVAAVIVAATVAALWMSFSESALDRFWAPVVAPEGAVLVCIGQPKSYFFRTQTQAELDKWFADPAEGRVPPRIIQSVPLSEFVPAWDKNISLSDAAAFARLSALFSRGGRDVALRGGLSVSLTDLRGRPVVLIGAFNNDWTFSLAGQQRYYFDVDRQRGGQLVRDRQNPDKVEWVVRNSWPHQKIALDYAIVSRVKNPVTEQVVVTAAGITQFGTQSAGEFLTTPAYFEMALRNAPADWSRRNMQVVLSAEVISGTPGPPKVLAVHFW